MSCDIKGTPKPKFHYKYEFTEMQQELIFGQYEKITLTGLQHAQYKEILLAKAIKHHPHRRNNISQHGQHTIP